MSKSLAFFFLFAVGVILSAEAQNSAAVMSSTSARNQVKKVKPIKTKADWLTALYLRPVENADIDHKNWPLIPAQMLESTPTDSVLTSGGPKLVRQLRKGDIVYHRESGIQVVSTWEVRIIHRKARRAVASYLAGRKEGYFLLEKRVAWEQ